MLDVIRQAFRDGSYVITHHYLTRLLERGINLQDLGDGMRDGAPEVIEDYPDHHISPCCLILCQGPSGTWYHLLASYGQVVHLITLYEPDPTEWSEDFRRRL